MNLHTKNAHSKLGIALVALLMLAGCQKSGTPDTAKQEAVAAKPAALPALTVRTTALREDEWGRTLSANGSIQPWQEAVITAQLPGLRISEVKVGLGDWVKQGDVLVTLGNLTRTGEEFIQGRVIAPDDGVISAANANVGSMVQGGVELFRLIRKGKLEWQAELTAEELMLLRKGMAVEVTVGDGRTVKGTVRAISPAVDPRTRYGHALVSLSDSRGIVAGAYARGTFDVSGKAKWMTLPQSAVMQRASETYVLIVGTGGRIAERKVETGSRNGDRVAIVKGLEANEPVVESGGAFLTEGDIVQVAK